MPKALSQIKSYFESAGSKQTSELLGELVVAIGFLWVFYKMLLISWVSEDAYITFRVIDNFLQGYGLRWNIYERVQVYTHPLWMLIHIPVYAIWHNIFLVNITLSLVCSAAAVILALWTVRKPTLVTVVCFFIPLGYSKSFIDYTSSGLENPLAYLLFAWFGYVMVRLQNSPRFWFWCSLTVALSMFNRLDTVIFYAPTLLWLVAHRWREVRWGQVFLGALPLIGWFAFSLIYYGFLFPNTKYAKLNTDMRFIRYLYHSWHYIKYFVVMDTLSAAMVLAPIAWLVHAWRRRNTQWGSQLPWLPMCLALGLYGYVLYIVYIGGDYMIGRFWGLPVFVATWIVFVFIPGNIRRDILFCIFCALLVTKNTPAVMKEIQKSCNSCVVGRALMVDASWTFRGNNLIIRPYPLRIRTEGGYNFAYDGKKLALDPDNSAKTRPYIGMVGFYGGPQKKIVDELALCDPLLARLPASKSQNFYAGHFRRPIPRGYLYAIDTGSTEKMHPSLAKYYEKLRLITSGELLNSERLKTILYFNLGYYDHWKQEYLERR